VSDIKRKENEKIDRKTHKNTKKPQGKPRKTPPPTQETPRQSSASLGIISS
jgi:hypothetical protein